MKSISRNFLKISKYQFHGIGEIPKGVGVVICIFANSNLKTNPESKLFSLKLVKKANLISPEVHKKIH